MFRVLFALSLLFVAQAARADELVGSVHVIYRDRFDDVLFRVAFETPPELPFWWISFSIPDVDPNTGMPATAGMAIQANQLVESGYMTLNYSAYVNGVYQRVSTTQWPYVFRDDVFESAIPFSMLHNPNREFYYESYVTQNAGDDPIYNTAYATINVPEPSGIVLALAYALSFATFATRRSRGKLSKRISMRITRSFTSSILPSMRSSF